MLDAIVTVTEAEIAAAVRLAAERSRLVVEPSGALAIAAMAFHAARGRARSRLDGPIVAVVSGGNVDPERYRELPRGADPARGLTGPARTPALGPPGARRARRPAARRAARSRIRISTSSASARRSARATSRASARIQPATTAQDRGQEDRRRRRST